MLGKLINLIFNIIMIPIVIVISIPIGIIKSRRNSKDRLLFTGAEQLWLSKAKRVINVDESALIKPDQDLVEVAHCIESSRVEYQKIKKMERFDQTFSQFLIINLNLCDVADWRNVIVFFELYFDNPIKIDEKEIKFIGVTRLMDEFQKYIFKYKRKYGSPPEILMLHHEVSFMFLNEGYYSNSERYFGKIKINVVSLSEADGGGVWKAVPPESN